MKRRLVILLALCLILCACGAQPQPQPEEADTVFDVYCTFEPLYALALPLFDGAQNTSLKCLVQPQYGSLPDYALSDWDSVVLSMADLLIASGQGLEGFATEGGTVPVFTASDGMTPLMNEEKETAIPYLYLSVQNAIGMTQSIAACLMQTDTQNADVYSANLEKQTALLEELLRQNEETLLPLAEQSVAVLFDGLLYLTEEYGIDAPVVISRSPAEGLEGTDYQSAVTKIREAGCGIVLLEEQVPDNLALDLTKEGFTVVRLDILSCGNDYISVMRENISRIAAAFGNEIT